MRSAWPRPVERILGGWAPTLRMAALLVVILTAGLIGILAAWGPLGLAWVVLLCALVRRIVSRLDRTVAI